MAKTEIAAPAVRTDRVGLKTIVCFVDPEIQRLVRIAAAEKDVRIQNVLEDAIFGWLKDFYAKDRQKTSALNEAIKRTKQRNESDAE